MPLTVDHAGLQAILKIERKWFRKLFINDWPRYLKIYIGLYIALLIKAAYAVLCWADENNLRSTQRNPLPLS